MMSETAARNSPGDRSVWASALIVGACLLAVAALLVLTAKRQVRRATPLVPEESIDSLKADVAEIKKDVHS